MTLYMPPHFRVDDRAALARFMDENGFATLVSHAAGGLSVSHVPLLVEAEGDALRLLGHVARNNDHWRALEAADEVLAIFHGPHAYVSPTWYAQHPSVPTWNYAVVHAHGKARLMDEARCTTSLPVFRPSTRQATPSRGGFRTSPRRTSRACCRTSSASRSKSSASKASSSCRRTVRRRSSA
jgi:predicted FMN-binding regulatory protein PaiB